MKIEKQVCSLQLSKKLKELGVKQESLFYWNLDRITKEWKVNDFIISTNDNTESFPAYTVAELGELLPEYDYYYPYSFKGNRPHYKYSCVYIFAQDNTIKHQVWGATEANARAKMLVFLLETKLITL